MKMNKIIIKHISIILSVVLLIVLVWFLFVYVFFDNELKKSIYPIIDDSKQMLSEIVSKDFAIDKTKKFISKFEKNKYISYLTIRNKQKKSKSANIDSVMLSALKLSYPIKSGDVVVGWVEVWPSYELVSKIFSNNINITIFLLSVIFLLVAFIFISYIYIKKYVFLPFKQIKMMINNIVLNKEVVIDETNEYGIWKNVFLDLKRLHNKVFDINTTMNLLLSATSTISSDLEFVNSVHVVFNVVQKRTKNSACALFVPDESGQLKVFAKNGLLKNGVTFVSQDPNNYIWKTYTDTIQIIINDPAKISKNNLCDLYEDDIGSLMTIPLIDEDKNCIGVFLVISKLEKSFDADNIEIINNVSKYLVALINRIKDYQKIKETNRKLEMEIEIASKELIETNSVLVKKIKDIRNISKIALYTKNKTNLSDSMEYLISKIKEILDVENFGIFIYNEEKNELSSVKGSFGLKESLQMVNKKGTIYSDVISRGESVILNDDSDLDNYSRNLLGDRVKLKSAIFLPIKQNDKVVAIIVAVNKVNSKFNFSDTKIFEHISIIIYGIIERDNLIK